jgi:hypothetical protein
LRRAGRLVVGSRTFEGLGDVDELAAFDGSELVPYRPQALGFGRIAHDEVGGLAAQRIGRRLEERLVVTPAPGLDVGEIRAVDADAISKLRLRQAAKFAPGADEMTGCVSNGHGVAPPAEPWGVL